MVLFSCLYLYINAALVERIIKVWPYYAFHWFILNHLQNLNSFILQYSNNISNSYQVGLIFVIDMQPFFLSEVQMRDDNIIIIILVYLAITATYLWIETSAAI